MKGAKIIAICNQKGGVGKTTTTVNLGIGLAKEGKRVLVIDADPQGDLTTCLGWKNGDELQTTLADLMNKTLTERPIGKGEGILHHEEGVDLLPSNLELSAMEMNLVNAMSRELTLKNCLKEIKKDYEYILIDCMPSLGMITVNALAAADSVMIPVQAQYLPAKGMTQLVQTIGKVQRTLNPDLRIDGIVLTLVDGRTNLAKQTLHILRNQYGNRMKIYSSQIPVAVKAAETSFQGKSIYAYDKNSSVAKAYENLTKEVIRNGEKTRDRLRTSEAR
ncbi:ParA family protein [Zhenpiania hominis]|uniref:ParA family protein n=1 Tax=Zhenpiania hominis TaxID=2763644 RepID=UPI0039F5DFDD